MNLGDLAESRVLSDLIEQGFHVSIPYHAVPYDLVAEKDGEFWRVQVKAATPRSDRPDVAKAQIKRSNRSENSQRQYSADDFDILAVWAKQYDAVAYTAWDEPMWSYSVRDSADDVKPQVRHTVNVIEEETVSKAIEKLK